MIEQFFEEGVCDQCGGRVYEREFAVFYCPRCKDLVAAKRIEEPYIDFSLNDCAILYTFKDSNLEYSILCSEFGSVIDDYPISVLHMIGTKGYSGFMREFIDVVYRND